MNDPENWFTYRCVCGRTQDVFTSKATCTCRCQRPMRRVFTEDYRGLRLKTGLSQRAAAVQLNIAFSYLSRIENGNAPVPAELAKKLANLYAAS